MKPMFGRGPSLQLRLFFALLLSVSLMLADSRLDAFAGVRYFLNTLVAPLQYASNVPRDTLDELVMQFRAHQRVVAENRALRKQVLQLESDQLLLAQTERENQRLRELLGSSFIRDERKMVAEVMAVDSDPYKHQVMLDKGRTNGVYEGQPVINEHGVVGQVAYVGAHNSRVLLLTDPTHAVPVQVMRNDIRVIASGRGTTAYIGLDNIPSSTDIKVGDKLVTSGLGGVFPEGYPVGTVTEFSFDNKRPFAQVTATTAVKFDRLRYLLLVWPTPEKADNAPSDRPMSQSSSEQENPSSDSTPSSGSEGESP
ncbi:rod shape-determining protein MreC [Salinivibrio sp. IB643]|uniref:rod shape-determining protein MreC n=1 Tax=Salinivibrio TaxID=51366 RepID=UPI000988DFFC|nr:rod shape-determining protein MreC [Salinivibrio sp. IB643]OOF00299.1 rod shape-determining protein MreC [Salinivibrio sp. IB643]